MTVEEYRHKMLSARRRGMKRLLDHMDELGFFTAPCSGGNHLCREGGLVEHSGNVIEIALALGKKLLTREQFQEMRPSIIIAAGLHDLGKCGDYDESFYIPNLLKSGKPSEAKPYKRNPELMNIPHSVRSIKIATEYIDLTDEEAWAIYAHDGLYDTAKYEIPGHETPLLMIIHWADMWASHVLEENKEA